MCYGFGGAIAGYAGIFKVLAGCGFLLVFLNFGLWYHFCCMHAAAVEEKPPEEKNASAVPGSGLEINSAGEEPCRMRGKP
jgi:hypothetical protein